jgi:UDP-N-acetylmuramoyl-tripeptide--D-alanyl-D-alanine ligase
MTIKELYQLYLAHPKVCIDTRTIVPNCLFFCIKGASFDGNKFALHALEQGAAFVITEDPSNVHPNLIFVDDVLHTLQQLATFHRNTFEFPVIGITGTNGKTTTKELIANLLKPKYSVAYTQGNFNNHIGVPLTLLAIDKQAQMAVIEMGANHPGEIAELCDIAQPDYGVITNIGSAHLEGFGGLDGVLMTKRALYESVRKNRGILFVNSDDALLMELSENDQRVLYGSKEGDVVGKIDATSDYLSVIVKPFDVLFRSNLIGNYNLTNVLCAIAIATYFKVEVKDIQTALTKYVPTNNRSQLIHTEKNEVVMDAYNANPSSMKVAIDHFLSMKKTNKVAILGEMKELGEYSSAEHKAIVDRMVVQNKVQTFFVGEEFVQAAKNTSIMTFSTSDEAATYFLEHPVVDSYILLKGSRGTKMESILPSL